MDLAQQAQGLALDLGPQKRRKIEALFKRRATGGAIEVKHDLGQRIGSAIWSPIASMSVFGQRGFGCRCFALPSSCSVAKQHRSDQTPRSKIGNGFAAVMGLSSAASSARSRLVGRR